MPLVTLPQGQVHYRDEGAGPLLVLLHANPGDSRDFDAIAPVLARTHRVLRLDWPGYGLSPAPSQPDAVTAMDFASTLQAFVDALALPPAVYLGNSVGGYAAVRLASDRPHAVTGLVLVSPGGFTPHNALTRLFCRLQGSTWSIPPAWLAQGYLRRRTATSRAMLARAGGEQSTPAARALNRAVWRSFTDPAHDLRGLASRLQVPTLLSFGRYDPLIPAWLDGRVARRQLPHAIWHVTATGHAAFAEAPEDFLRLLQPFLRGVELPRRTVAPAPMPDTTP